MWSMDTNGILVNVDDSVRNDEVFRSMDAKTLNRTVC